MKLSHFHLSTSGKDYKSALEGHSIVRGLKVEDHGKDEFQQTIWWTRCGISYTETVEDVPIEVKTLEHITCQECLRGHSFDALRQIAQEE